MAHIHVVVLGQSSDRLSSSASGWAWRSSMDMLPIIRTFSDSTSASLIRVVTSRCASRSWPLVSPECLEQVAWGDWNDEPWWAMMNMVSWWSACLIAPRHQESDSLIFTDGFLRVLWRNRFENPSMTPNSPLLPYVKWSEMLNPDTSAAASSTFTASNGFQWMHLEMQIPSDPIRSFQVPGPTDFRSFQFPEFQSHPDLYPVHSYYGHTGRNPVFGSVQTSLIFVDHTLQQPAPAAQTAQTFTCSTICGFSSAISSLLLASCRSFLGGKPSCDVHRFGVWWLSLMHRMRSFGWDIIRVHLCVHIYVYVYVYIYIVLLDAGCSWIFWVGYLKALLLTSLPSRCRESGSWPLSFELVAFVCWTAPTTSLESWQILAVQSFATLQAGCQQNRAWQ